MAHRTRLQSASGRVAALKATTPVKESIFLFIPNLIGYVRVVLAIVSLYYMPLHPRRCFFLYSISCLLDALDGVAARTFNQSTKFGAVLDMVTDRCTTTCLLVFLAAAKPRWTILFQLLISLDFTSHYMHMYATLTMGGSDQSHKKIDQKRSKIMHLYYSNRKVLFLCCFLNELFFVALYLLCFASPLDATPPTNTESSFCLSESSDSSPATSISFSDPWSAGAMEMARANKLNSSIPKALLIISTPGMLFKQVVNVVQIVKASQWLAQGDREDRAKLGLPKKAKKQN